MSRKYLAVALTIVLVNFTWIPFSAFAQQRMKNVEHDLLFLPPIVEPTDSQKESETQGKAKTGDPLSKPTKTPPAIPAVKPANRPPAIPAAKPTDRTPVKSTVKSPVTPIVKPLVKPLVLPSAHPNSSDSLPKSSLDEIFAPPATQKPILEKTFDLKEPSSVFKQQEKKPSHSNNSAADVDFTDGCDSCSDGFSRFIEPVSNPIWFMDPRIRSRARAVFINQMIPEGSILQGGDLQVYALQISLALSDRVSFIANKDGYQTLQADAFNGANTEGWADLAAGFQFNLIKDDAKKYILSAGLIYELSQGTREVFQGNGDGMWHFYFTAGKEFGDDGRNHFISTVGWHLPNNPNGESESIYYSFHFDHELKDGFYALWETNGIVYVQDGKRSAATVEGGDWLNLGANVQGNHFISMAWGLAYKLNSRTDLAAAYEVPITGREDLMDNRTTVTLSIDH